MAAFRRLCHMPGRADQNRSSPKQSEFGRGSPPVSVRRCPVSSKMPSFWRVQTFEDARNLRRCPRSCASKSSKMPGIGKEVASLRRWAELFEDGLNLRRWAHFCARPLSIVRPIFEAAGRHDRRIRHDCSRRSNRNDRHRCAQLWTRRIAKVGRRRRRRLFGSGNTGGFQQDSDL
jgi:hypothetical protein